MYSIIYVNYKSLDLVKKSIESVIKYSHDHDYEIIVVDNCSGDDLSELEVLSGPSLKLIYNDSNSGFGSAVNLGARHAIGRYLILLNPDAFLCVNAIEKINSFYSEEESRADYVLGANIIDEEGQSTVSFGCFPSLKQELLNVSLISYMFPDCLKNLSTSRTVDRNLDQPFEVDYVSGAFCCIPKVVFERLDGFDTDFFLYFEETEFFKRFRDSGGSCFVLPEIIITHAVSSITGDKSDFKIKNLEIGRFLYFKKTRGFIAFSFYRILRAITTLLLLVKNRRGLYLDLFKLWICPSLSSSYKEYTQYKRNLK